MTVFKIDPSVAGVLPGLTVAAAVWEGQGQFKSPELEAKFRAETEALFKRVQAELADVTPAQIPVVQQWRDAYKKFKAPKDSSCSIELLLRRIKNGKFPPAISPLVDILNYVSVAHRFPVGGEDLAAMSGTLRLTIAAGGEVFHPLGGGEAQAALAGELIYRDDVDVVCRALNWRESNRTKIEPTTTRAIIVVEAPASEEKARVIGALATMGAMLRDYLDTSRFEVQAQ